jgi:subtilase family serine protease
MRPAKASLVIPVLLTLFPALAQTVQPDRISEVLDSGQASALRGNVHGMARPEFDLGRTDGGKVLSGVSIVFKPSASQQQALDKLLADQQNPASPNYHKWLTPAQFANRFGMTRNDIQKVATWLESQGFKVTRVANSRNQIFFEGTVAQIESAFHTEIHDYLIDGEVHFANASDPAVPSAMADSALAIQNLHNFQPKPRLHPHFTSHISGEHFIAPADFATIYDLQGIYSAGIDGTGQKIAVTGQSNINPTDVANYRSAAGLPTNAPTVTLVPNTGTGATCPGDEGESDLDVEFSGGIAKNASITLYYAGLATGDTCTSRQFGAFNALTYIIDNKLAPVISNSYGLCEAEFGNANASAMRTQAQQANIQGQTIISASGDSGAADCDFHVTSATKGLAVDLPAAIPEVTGAGGTEFTGDSATCPTTGCPNNTAPADPPYWSGSGVGTDTISSAQQYIPEMAWNDTAFDIAHGGFISASGGGASIFFGKPNWQTGTGVPNDNKRDVPDISVSASADHDGYLFCSEDGPNGKKVSTCTSGFRDASSKLDVVGGTSVAAPTLSGVVALLNQYLGNTPPGGLGNINPNLYQFVASNPTAFNDVPAASNNNSNNIVPCTKGTPNCPASAPFQYGFNTGTGYDQVTGLGSVNGFTLAQAWLATIPHFSVSPTPSSLNASAGQVTGQSTITATPQNGFNGTVTFSCASLPQGATCNFSPTSSTSASLTISTKANMKATSNLPVTVNGTGNKLTFATTIALTVTPTTESFTLSANTSTLNLQPGQSAGNTVNLTVSDPNNTGFIVNNQTTLPLNYQTPCTVSPPVPEGPTCVFSPSGGQGVTVTNPTVAIVTIAPTAKLIPPLERRTPIFYAMLLPGIMGLAFAARSRPRAIRLLGPIVVLGFSTLWLGSCGGNSSSQKNPGTPAGSYTVTINATTGGAAPLTGQTHFTVNVQ